MVRVVDLRARHAGQTVHLRWRMATNQGVDGFDIYATAPHGTAHRLNRHTISVHRSRAYHIRLRYSGDASVSLRVVLTNGSQLNVPTG